MKTVMFVRSVAQEADQESGQPTIERIIAQALQPAQPGPAETIIHGTLEIHVRDPKAMGLAKVGSRFDLDFQL